MKKSLCLFATLAWLGICGVTTADAFNLDLGNDVSLDVDVTLTYALGMRLEDPDKKLISDTSAAVVDLGLLNADDGNRNFEEYDLVNNRVSATIDMDLQYKDVGVFARPRAFFDWAYDGSNANDDPLSNNNMNFYGGPLDRTDRFTSDTQDRHRDTIELLDIFAYGDFDIADHAINIKVGRHVLSWGESVFLQGSVSAGMNTLDATATNVPGVELKEIFLPVEQVSASIEIVPGLTLAGFAKWRWEKFRLDEAGSYFSTSDVIDEAGERMLFPVALTNPGLPLAATIDRVKDDEARDGGQWGVALQSTVDVLGGLDLGLFYINYHERVPMVNWQAGGGTMSPSMVALGGDWNNAPLPSGLGDLLNMADMSSYFSAFAEDVKLIGASVSGVVGETNVALEVTYRDDIPVQVVDPLSLLGFGWEKAEILQAQMSFISFLGDSMLWDNLTALGEVGINTATGISKSKLFNDKTAWAFTLQGNFEYFQIMDGLDLKIPLTLKMNPDGVSSLGGTFTENKDSIGINFDFTYQGNVQFGLGYVNYLHSVDKNPLADRDFVSAKLKYTF